MAALEKGENDKTSEQSFEAAAVDENSGTKRLQHDEKANQEDEKDEAKWLQHDEKVDKSRPPFGDFHDEEDEAEARRIWQLHNSRSFKGLPAAPEIMFG